MHNEFHGNRDTDPRWRNAPIRPCARVEDYVHQVAREIHRSLELLWRAEQQNPLSEFLLMRRPDVPSARKWTAAYSYANRLTPHLASPVAWLRLKELAEDERMNPRLFLRTTLFPSAALFAAQTADNLQYVRIGRRWVTGADGQKLLVKPWDSLNWRAALNWYNQRIYREAERLLLEPVGDGDALRYALGDLDLNLEREANVSPEESGRNIVRGLDALLQAARPSQRALLQRLSPSSLRRILDARELLASRAVEHAGTALELQGLTPGALRALLCRLRKAR